MLTDPIMMNMSKILCNDKMDTPMNTPSDLKNMSCTASSTYSHYGPDPGNHPDQEELSAVVGKLRNDPMGYFLLATDGVVRTHTIDDEVVDAFGPHPD
ncbi:uncharacterized protein N7483_011681 [Penicillium malachiteum]|uniref:uncharacterized protein n=1 Tax=Penicillium malachiteum TaxID=1324776 RepID=UPI002548DB4D|nr:uncharacterized protein N7483_011681 [Penicillium malachiteum]KAJ5714500.1 hypothetical protein N7483_011681 [Penicillium malachiteum]